MKASKFVQPIDYYGQYKTASWAGYVYKESLGYTSGRHTGVDYNGPGAGNADLGLPIRSVANGVVRYVGNNSNIGFGLTTIIEHPLTAKLKAELGCGSLFSRYMHQNTQNVQVGQEVSVGQVIGSVGNTGTQWAHLHLDLYKNTIEGGGVHLRYDKDTQLLSYVDPFEFIQAHPNEEPDVNTNQRVLENRDGVNQRAEPTTNSNIIKAWPYDEEPFTFKGFVYGQDPYGAGNNVWFVGAFSGGYFYSGAFVDKTTNGLPNLTPPSPEPSPDPDPPAPEPEQPVMFAPDSTLVRAVYPSPNYGTIVNGQVDKTATQTPKFIVIHQWGAPQDNYTRDGVISHLTKPSTEVGVQYVVDDSGIYQLVKENKRAWHAGAQGNDGIGLELDPNGTEAMYSNARAIITDIRSRYGKLELKKHSDFMATQCPKYIDMSKLEVVVPDYDKENNALLKQILAIVQWIKNKLEGVFK